MIFYTKRFVPKPHKAYVWWFLIFIHPDYRHDKGLLEHEKVHRKQWLRTIGLHGLLYRFVPEYRLAAEIEAFREQAKHYPDDRMPRFAELIASNYKLKITAENALKLLRESD